MTAPMAPIHTWLVLRRSSDSSIITVFLPIPALGGSFCVVCAVFASARLVLAAATTRVDDASIVLRTRVLEASEAGRGCTSKISSGPPSRTGPCRRGDFHLAGDALAVDVGAVAAVEVLERE